MSKINTAFLRVGGTDISAYLISYGFEKAPPWHKDYDSCFSVEETGFSSNMPKVTKLGSERWDSFSRLMTLNTATALPSIIPLPAPSPIL